MNSQRFLLIKIGKFSHFRKKRFCSYQKEGLFLYFLKEASHKPKGSFLLSPNNFLFEQVPSFLKDKLFCIKLTIGLIAKKGKIMWIFPLNKETNDSLMCILIELSSFHNKIPYQKIKKKHLLYSSFLSQKSFKTPKIKQLSLSKALDLSIPYSSSSSLSLEVLSEGSLPSEIRELSLFIQNKSHEPFFQDIHLQKRPLTQLDLTEIDLPMLFQKNPPLFFQGFRFPKCEDVLELEERLLDNKEWLLTMGRRFLWEFQLENALKIFQMFPKDEEFKQGFLEIELMKVLISGKRSLISGLMGIIEEKVKTYKINKINKADEKQTEKELLLSELLLVKGLLNSLLQNKFQAFLSLKEAHSFLQKPYSSFKALESSSLLKESFSRYLFLKGAFQIGLSLLPKPFRKALELLGVESNTNKGVSHLKQCILQGGNRSCYARLLLGLFLIESEGGEDFGEAFNLIKDSIKDFGKSPLFNWLAALFSWRFLKGDEAHKLIQRALDNVGGELANEAYYLRFEQAWFELSHCQWNNASFLFEEIAIVALDLFNFDEKLFLRIIATKPLTLTYYKGKNPFTDLITRSKSLYNSRLDQYPGVSKELKDFNRKSTIVLPHRNTLALVLSVCYVKEERLSELWLLMVEYLDRRFIKDPLRTGLDDDISSLSKKYLKRRYKGLIKYEVLYFLKEISKLKESQLLQLKESIHAYFETIFPDFSLSNKVSSIIKSLNPSLLTEFTSGTFLLLIISCVLRQLEQVWEYGKVLYALKGVLPRENTYLLHHGFHWAGRCRVLMEGREKNKEKEALEMFNLSKALEECEFNMRIKNKRAMKECKRG